VGSTLPYNNSVSDAPPPTPLTIPRLLIGGVTSGVGKTTVAAGLAAAFRRRGLRVQPFKCGPDYIDPSHLTRAAGTPARNLDSWILPHGVLREVFGRAAAGAGIAVVEGMMGLFDGRAGEDTTGSSAEIAALLQAPVLLVLDVGKVARSAAAVALGFQRFDPSLRLAGFILNNVANPRHRAMVEGPLTEVTGLPVLGALPRSEALRIPERHLGLVPDAELEAGGRPEVLASAAETHCDVAAIAAIAAGAPPFAWAPTGLFPQAPVAAPPVRIAVARDRAFNFYYEDNLDLLAAWGGVPAFFSPLDDGALPAGSAGLYLGGGFPEVFAAELAANGAMRRAVAGAVDAGMPVVAECGGLMYLASGITDATGATHPMVGVLPGRCVMRQRRSRLGYLTVRARGATPLLAPGEAARGHEFHWSDYEGPPAGEPAFTVVEDGARTEGFAAGNLVASYVHLHFGAGPGMARRFVAACRTWRGQ